MQMTTEQFKQELARVDWYYHYLERGFASASAHFKMVAKLATGNPEWLALWEAASPSKGA